MLRGLNVAACSLKAETTWAVHAEQDDDPSYLVEDLVGGRFQFDRLRVNGAFFVELVSASAPVVKCTSHVDGLSGMLPVEQSDTKVVY